MSTTYISFVAPNNFTKKYLPPGAQSCSAIFNFHAPPGFDLNAISRREELEVRIRSGLLISSAASVGETRRSTQAIQMPPTLPWEPICMGAGFSSAEASFISNSFALTMSSNAGSPQQSDYRNLGYDLAAAGWNPSCH